MRRSAATALAVTVAGLVVAACATPAPGSGPVTSPGRLDIRTEQVICGGAAPPPGEPACRPPTPASRSIEVASNGAVVAQGTSDGDGILLLDVPPGDLVVSHPGAQPWEQCDAPSVGAVAGTTIEVHQTCTLDVP